MSYIHIVKDHDADFNRQYNLYNTKTKSFLLPDWVNNIERIDLGDGEERFLVREYNNFYDNGELIVDNTGKNIFSCRYGSLSIWRPANEKESCILKARYEGGRGEFLLSLDEVQLTDPYDSIDEQNPYKDVVKIKNHSGEISYLSYPDFKRITPYWFDGTCPDNKRWTIELRNDKNFIAIVKHLGRWQALFLDGTFKKA